MAEPMRGIVLSRVEYPIFHLALAAVGASLLNPEEAKNFVRSNHLHRDYTRHAASACVHEFKNRTLNRVSSQVRQLANCFYGNMLPLHVQAREDRHQAKARYGIGNWVIYVHYADAGVTVGTVVDQAMPMWPSPYACFEMCVEQLIPTVCDLVGSLYESGGWDEAEQIAF